MFSLRSRAVRFRQLWMETRLELIYNVVIATRRPAPNTPTKPVDTHGNRVVERISVDEALSHPLAGDLVGQTPRCRTCPVAASVLHAASCEINSKNILASEAATATRGQPARIDIPSMRHHDES